jgi:hypothetical protein
MLSLLLSITACSNRAIYDNAQLNQRQECEKQPPLTYRECIAQADQNYDHYQRERNELLETSEDKQGTEN